MPERHWGNEFAVGLVAGGTLVLVILVFWYGPTCSPDFPCGYPHQNEPNNGSIWYDTAAQWLAAFTGVTVAIFTFWTVLLVRKTLSADDAALHEAREQTKIARSVGEAQTRAFVGVVGEKIDGLSRESVIFEIKNFGQSIARDVNICITWSLIADNFSESLQNESLLQNPIGSLHPGQTVDSTFDTKSPVKGSGQPQDFFQEVKRLAKNGYVFGYVTYVDIFNVVHKTGIGRTLEFSDGAYRVHYCKHGNEAD